MPPLASAGNGRGVFQLRHHEPEHARDELGPFLLFFGVMDHPDLEAAQEVRSPPAAL
jgi:hypothetical protein